MKMIMMYFGSIWMINFRFTSICLINARQNILFTTRIDVGISN